MSRGTSVEGLPFFPLNVELKLNASTVVPFLNHLMGTLKKKKSGLKFVWGGGGEKFPCFNPFFPKWKKVTKLYILST